MAYFKTVNVKAFPTSNRTAVTDGKLTSEENLVNIINSIVDYDSYVIGLSNEVNPYDNTSISVPVLSVVIHGYFFKIYDFNQRQFNNLWLSIEVENATAGGETLVNFSDNSITPLDTDTGFLGLYYGNSPITISSDDTNRYGNYKIYNLQVIKEGAIVNKIKLKGENISYPGVDEEDRSTSIIDKIDEKQNNLTVSSGIILENTSDTSSNLKLDFNVVEPIEKIKNKGSNTKFIYFDSTGTAQESSADIGSAYFKDSSSVYHTRSTYTENGTLKGGVRVYFSQNSPDASLGGAGDIWFKYTTV